MHRYELYSQRDKLRLSDTTRTRRARTLERLFSKKRCHHVAALEYMHLSIVSDGKVCALCLPIWGCGVMNRAQSSHVVSLAPICPRPYGVQYTLEHPQTHTHTHTICVCVQQQQQAKALTFIPKL